ARGGAPYKRTSPPWSEPTPQRFLRIARRLWHTGCRQRRPAHEMVADHGAVAEHQVVARCGVVKAVITGNVLTVHLVPRASSLSCRQGVDVEILIPEAAAFGLDLERQQSDEIGRRSAGADKAEEASVDPHPVEASVRRTNAIDGDIKRAVGASAHMHRDVGVGAPLLGC